MVRSIFATHARVRPPEINLAQLVDPSESVLTWLTTRQGSAEPSALPALSLVGPGGVALPLLATGVDFGAMLDFPPWTGRVFIYAGLCLFLLGLMAWLGSHQLHRRAWGRRLTLSGGGLFVVGTAWGTFVGVVRYVLG